MGYTEEAEETCTGVRTRPHVRKCGGLRVCIQTASAKKSSAQKTWTSRAQQVCAVCHRLHRTSLPACRTFGSPFVDKAPQYVCLLKGSCCGSENSLDHHIRKVQGPDWS